MLRPHQRLLVSTVIGLLVAACGGDAADRSATAPQAGSTEGNGTEWAAPPVAEDAEATGFASTFDDPVAEETAAAPATDSPPPAAAAPEPTPAASVLAAQETNWPGVIAEVTEFRRKGNTLTAKIRLRNQGTETAQPDIKYDEAYVIDLAAGKKYEVLRDEKNRYIAALKTGWNDRWYEKVEPGQAKTVWMKLPAPPPEVREVTLQLPGVPPFEDLAIQDD